MTRIWKIQVSQVSDFTPWSWGNHGHDVKLTNLHSTREATLAWRTVTSFLRSRKVNKQCNIQSNKIEVSQRGLEAILPYVTDVSILTVSLIISAGFVHPFRTQMHMIQGSRGGSSYSSAHTLCNAKFYRVWVCKWFFSNFFRTPFNGLLISTF